MNMKENVIEVIENIRGLAYYMKDSAQTDYKCNRISYDEREKVEHSVELLNDACKLMEEYSRVLDEQNRKLDMILEKLGDKA